MLIINAITLIFFLVVPGIRKQTGTGCSKLTMMDDLRFDVLFNIISVILGRWTDDNEMLRAMEPLLRLKISLLQAGSKPVTARSVGQRLTH